MTARWLLFEEQYGIHLRAREREERVREARYADQYAESVRLLKKQQQAE